MLDDNLCMFIQFHTIQQLHLGPSLPDEDRGLPFHQFPVEIMGGGYSSRNIGVDSDRRFYLKRKNIDIILTTFQIISRPTSSAAPVETKGSGGFQWKQRGHHITLFPA